jgi:hypothetical protein
MLYRAERHEDNKKVIAKNPALAVSVNSSIPPVVSNIIAKLLWQGSERSVSIAVRVTSRFTKVRGVIKNQRISTEVSRLKVKRAKARML